jgi:hypothetical protein
VASLARTTRPRRPSSSTSTRRPRREALCGRRVGRRNARVTRRASAVCGCAVRSPLFSVRQL